MTQLTRRKVTGFAIDSPSSKDLDDAILLEEEKGGGFKVTVSISDVSGTVTKGSDIDSRAFERAFTRYFAQGNNPMIPSRLADNALSLLPKQQRDVLVFEVSLDESFEITNVSVELGSFWSKRRYTHKQVDAVLDDDSHGEHHMWMSYYKFAEALLNKRRQEGAMVIYDLDQGLYTTEEGQVVAKQPGEYFRPYVIVQEFMILVNYAVTVFLADQGVNLLYRNHAALVNVDGSNQKDVIQKLYGSESITPEILTELNERMRRLAGRAKYEASCKGHLGLSLSAYTHWTSPIRRYADLVNHRQALAWLKNDEPAYTVDELKEIGSHLNEVYGEVKDRVKNSHKTQAKKGLQDADLDKLVSLESGHFSHFVRMLVEEELPLTEQRALAIVGRMQDETLPLVDFTCILFTEVPDDTLWRQLQENALQALASHPNNVRSMLNMAQQKLGWKNDIKSSPRPNGQYETTVSIWRRDRTYTSEPCTGQGKAESEIQAIFDMLRRMHTIHIELPKKGTKSMAGSGNQKGVLFECCQQKRWPMPNFSTEQKGPSHQPLFSCVGKLQPKGREELVTKPCQSTTRKSAEQLAAKELLILIGVESSDGSATAPESDVATDWRNNPVSALQEHCQKHGIAMPEYHDEKSGPDHAPEFKAWCVVELDGSSEVFESNGSNKKEAKKNAASKACEQVFAAT